MAGRARDGRARRPRVAGRRWGRGAPWSPGPGGPETFTVQLLPHFLADGDLPRTRVGDVLDVAPAIYAASLESGRGRDRRRDEWVQDEFGTLEAVGSMLAARLDPDSCSCWVDVLDVAGRLVPLNPAAAYLDDAVDDAVGAGTSHGPRGAPDDGAERVRVSGALYLDPELGPGTPYGSAVALCRRRYRVAAIRRYRRTAGVPVNPVGLPTTPPPGAVDEDGVYVAELVALDTGPTP